MRRKVKAGKQKTAGYGFVGRWADGTLGWAMPTHLGASVIEHPRPAIWNRGEPSYLCRITVEQVFDSRGYPIVRYIPKGADNADLP